MTHTLPDYTTKYKMTNIFSNIDTAELAVRLGSGVIYDRRGNVVDYDDFEHGSLKWDNDFTAHAGTVAVSTDTARSGGKSLKIVTANAVADRMNIYRYVTPTFNTNIGMELSFAGVSSYYRLWMYVAGWLSPASFQAGLRYTKDSHLLEYFNTDGTWTTLDDSAYVYPNQFAFYPIKVVADFTSGSYVRALFLDQEYDMSAISTYAFGASNSKFLKMSIYVEARTTAAQTVFIDDVILTQNEP